VTRLNSASTASSELRPDHWLARTIGIKGARLVCQRIGGEVSKIPVATAIRNKMRATGLREQNKSWNEIAAELNLSESHVQEFCRGIEKGAGGQAAEDARHGDDHCPVCGRRLRRRAEAVGDGRQMTFPLPSAI